MFHITVEATRGKGGITSHFERIRHLYHDTSDVTKSTGERSFSNLEFIKNTLPTTMPEDRLNILSV